MHETRPKSYLTIDDSPTNETDRLTDYLESKGIPAVLFCIGSAYKDMHVQCEGMEQMPQPILNAISKGFDIGNHTYTHPRSSELTFKEVVAEIEKTEKLIDGLYKQAGKSRKAKMLRFPHLDRGCGGWVVDYAAAGDYRVRLESLFLDGLNVTLQPPTDAMREKKAKIQDYLKREGFTADVFKGVTHNWYTDTEMALARDSLMTFSTSDWMMNPDFTEASQKMGWPHKSVDALKGKIDADRDLWSKASTNIVLAHDHNRMFEVTRDLIAHMQSQGMEFINI